MNDIESIIAEHNAVRALISHWAALDAGDYEAVATGFAEDGVWHRQGKELKGPRMVRAAMAERPKGALTRHVVTNIRAAIESGSEAAIDVYMTVFAHQGEPDAPLPAPMNVPITVGPGQARLRLVDGRWKIAYLKSAVTFQRS